MKWLALILFLSSAAVARAGVASADLGTVEADPPADARLPLATLLRGEQDQPVTLGDALGGVPSVLVFADYTCSNLCGPILAFAAAGLAKTGLAAGSAYRLVVVGLDPKDTLEAAEEMKRSRVGEGTPVARATVILRGGDSAIAALTKAAGYHYTYDAEHDQFAHPAAADVVTGDGRIARVLSGLGLDPADLRLALVEAGDGRVGTLADRIRLLCYGFDPALGIYTENITAWLAIGGVLTLAVLASGILLMVIRSRRGQEAAG